MIGKDVPYALLQAIAETPDAELRAGLSNLQAAELLYAVSLFPDLELTFKHALTHEVAYGSLLQERRRVLHARIVEAIERLYPDRLEEHTERLAHHALRGHLWDRALAYLREAATRAMGRSAGHEAVGYLEQALAALEHMPLLPDRETVAIDLRFDLRTAHFSMNECPPAHRNVQEARALAEAAGDRRRLGRTLVYEAHHQRIIVDHRQAVDVAERAYTLAKETNDLGLQIAAAEIAGTSSFEMGDFDHAISRLRDSVALLTSDLSRSFLGLHLAPAVISRGYLAFALAWRGQFAAATEHVAAGVRLAEEMGRPLTMRVSYDQRSLVSLVKGDVLEAIPWLERSLAISEQIHLPSLGDLAFLGHAYAQVGRVEEAIHNLETVLKRADERGWRLCVSLWAGWLAGAYLQAGRVDEARETAARAVQMGRDHQERGFQGMALRELGDAVASGKKPDITRAEDLHRRALAIAEELGMRPLQAHCHLGLGKVHRRAGRPEDARAEPNQALDLYLSMEMRHWLTEAEAELAAID